MCVCGVYRREGAIVVGHLALCLERGEVPHKSGLGCGAGSVGHTQQSQPPTHTNTRVLLTSVESYVVLSLYYEGSICMCTLSLSLLWSAGNACDGKALSVMAQAATRHKSLVSHTDSLLYKWGNLHMMATLL